MVGLMTWTMPAYSAARCESRLSSGSTPHIAAPAHGPSPCWQRWPLPSLRSVFVSFPPSRPYRVTICGTHSRPQMVTRWNLRPSNASGLC